MISAILLAAGQSSRMGRVKALLPWGDTTLLEAQIEQVARSPVKELTVVVGFNHEQLRPILTELKARWSRYLPITVIHNRHYQLGKTSSIRAGMSGLSRTSRAVVILGVDQPVHAQTLNQLISGLAEDKIRIPVFAGRKGHPPLFPARYYRELANVSEEREGLREIIRNHPHHIQYVEVQEPQVLLNLNSEQDYLDAKEKGLDCYNTSAEARKEKVHVYSRIGISQSTNAAGTSCVTAKIRG